MPTPRQFTFPLFLFLSLTVACSGSNPSGPSSSPTVVISYGGVLVTEKAPGKTGSITLTATVAATASGSPAPSQAVVSASGTVATQDQGTVPLSGTYDGGTATFKVSGAGYPSISATVKDGVLTGDGATSSSSSSPSIPIHIVAVQQTSAQPAQNYCGTFTGNSTPNVPPYTPKPVNGSFTITISPTPVAANSSDYTVYGSVNNFTENTFAQLFGTFGLQFGTVSNIRGGSVSAHPSGLPLGYSSNASGSWDDSSKTFIGTYFAFSPDDSELGNWTAHRCP
jgi:hypothetical protein